MAAETVIFVAIAIGALIFGSKKLPELARSVGRAQVEFEKAKIEARNEIRNHTRDDNDGMTGGHVDMSSNSDLNMSAAPKTDYHQVSNNFTSKSSSSSLVSTTSTGPDNYRTRLQNAAKKIGIENPEKLSDDELNDAIRKGLDS